MFRGQKVSVTDTAKRIQGRQLPQLNLLLFPNAALWSQPNPSFFESFVCLPWAGRGEERERERGSMKLRQFCMKKLKVCMLIPLYSLFFLSSETTNFTILAKISIPEKCKWFLHATKQYRSMDDNIVVGERTEGGRVLRNLRTFSFFCWDVCPCCHWFMGPLPSCLSLSYTICQVHAPPLPLPWPDRQMMPRQEHAGRKEERSKERGKGKGREGGEHWTTYRLSDSTTCTTMPMAFRLVQWHGWSMSNIDSSPSTF